MKPTQQQLNVILLYRFNNRIDNITVDINAGLDQGFARHETGEMDASETKGLCIVLLFIGTLLCGWPPYFLVLGKSHSQRAIRVRATIISYLTCFAGGVFLGAVLIHLLPEGRENMEEYLERVDKVIEFPLYEAVAACGFFLIAVIEQLTHRLLHKSNHIHSRRESQSEGPGRSHDDHNDHELVSESHSSPVFSGGSIKRGGSIRSCAECRDQNSNNSCGHMALSEQLSGPTCELFRAGSFKKIEENTSFSTEQENGGSHGVKVDVIQQPWSTHTDKQNINSKVSEKPESEEPVVYEQEIVEIVDLMDADPLRAFLLLGAMSFHTVFDGLAVGLEKDPSSIWGMFTAIAIHKSLVAVCLGMQLFLAYRRKPIKAFLWIFFFSLISPIGLGVGMILTSGNIDEVGELLVSWILQGLATGTFLYITFFEILRVEFAENGGLLKLLVAAVGFGGMVVAKILDRD